MAHLFRSLLVFFFGIFLTMPLTLHAESMLEKNARIWSQEVVALYKQKNWQALRSITPLSNDFQQTSVWKNPEFLRSWQGWQKESALQSWQPGSSGISIWRLSEGENALRPTIGIKKERDGTWWAVFVQPQNAKNSTHPGWPCPKSCSLKISSGNMKQSFMARPPMHQEFEKVHTLGMPFPSSFLTQEPSLQKWEVVFPSGEKAVFDVSFARGACQKHYADCQF